jgi:ABC-type transport system substrate-binding protein
MLKAVQRALIPALLPLLAACGAALNDPYPAAERGQNILYSAFIAQPKHLDPIQSYSEDEKVFTAQIYEPPLQYHYLKRPYVLQPATVEEVPPAPYFDAVGRLVPADTEAAHVAYSDYILQVRPGIRYQPHPAFAEQPAEVWQHFNKIDSLKDFPATGTRELTAADYVYEIKRLAHPRLHSPIYGLMSEYIIGLPELSKALRAHSNAHPNQWLDLRNFELSGVQVLDTYRYRIRIKGKYPQFLYWMAMPFFAPIPWEADRFYSRPGMAEKNLGLDWYPVGTGPYMLAENDPNARMVLERNPNFHSETYPCEGEAGDREAGLLNDCGKTLPFIDKAVFTREKEQIPYWNKFLQGYYDASGIASDSFDQAIQVGGSGEVGLSETMQQQGIALSTSVSISSMYMGFNGLDPIVGGNSASARKLRQALAIALNQEEFISIFTNGRGVAAQGPIPPGIFGYRPGRAGIDPEVYDWEGDDVGGRPKRKSIEVARQRLAEAGYPNGRDAKTGAPLVIYLDTTLTGVGAKSRIDWLSKQFRKIDVQLVVRSTDYNRFQEKLLKGNAQLFYFGWNADYPDPENFLFLLHGPQGKVKYQGENAANYQNPEYDRLFEQVKTMDNGPTRQLLINRMVAILREDAPWIWGFHPMDYTLSHQWLYNRKPIKVGDNILKYQRVDPVLREQKRREWNRPAMWPGIAILVALFGVAGYLVYRRRL